MVALREAASAVDHFRFDDRTMAASAARRDALSRGGGAREHCSPTADDHIGFGTGSTGIATAMGTGSTSIVDTQQAVIVGRGGTGTLNVNSGGSANFTQNVSIGENSGLIATRGAAEIEAWLALALAERTTLAASYSSQIGDDTEDHGASAHLSVRF